MNNFELTAGVRGIFYLIPQPNFVDEFQPWQKFSMYDPAPIEKVEFEEIEVASPSESLKTKEKTSSSKKKSEFQEEDLF